MRNIFCRLFGHNTECRQDAILLAHKNALFEHSHVCRRCHRVRAFPTEYLRPEWEDMLRHVVDAENHSVRVAMDPSYAHPHLEDQ